MPPTCCHRPAHEHQGRFRNSNSNPGRQQHWHEQDLDWLCQCHRLSPQQQKQPQLQRDRLGMALCSCPLGFKAVPCKPHIEEQHLIWAHWIACWKPVWRRMIPFLIAYLIWRCLWPASFSERRTKAAVVVHTPARWAWPVLVLCSLMLCPQRSQGNAVQVLSQSQQDAAAATLLLRLHCKLWRSEVEQLAWLAATTCLFFALQTRSSQSYCCCSCCCWWWWKGGGAHTSCKWMSLFGFVFFWCLLFCSPYHDI